MLRPFLHGRPRRARSRKVPPAETSLEPGPRAARISRLLGEQRRLFGEARLGRGRLLGRRARLPGPGRKERRRGRRARNDVAGPHRARLARRAGPALVSSDFSRYRRARAHRHGFRRGRRRAGRSARRVPGRGAHARVRRARAAHSPSCSGLPVSLRLPAGLGDGSREGRVRGASPVLSPSRSDARARSRVVPPARLHRRAAPRAAHPRERDDGDWPDGHVCPPSSQFAAYNKIRSAKSRVLYPDFEHEDLPGWSDREWEFFAPLLG